MNEQLTALVPLLVLALKALGITGSIGLLGTLLESIGERFGYPKLVRFGQGLEGIAADIPKLIRGSRATKLQAEIELLKGNGPKTPRGAYPRPPSVPPSAAGLLLLAGALALSPSLVGCSPASTPEARGAQAADLVRLGYGGARVTLRELYAIHLGLQKAITTPEQAQFAAPKLRIALEGLDRAKAALRKAKPFVASGKDEAEVRKQLRAYLAELDAVLPLLGSLGGLPSEDAGEALDLLRGFLAGGAS